MDQARGLAARSRGLEKDPRLDRPPEDESRSGHAPAVYRRGRPHLPRPLPALRVQLAAELEGVGRPRFATKPAEWPHLPTALRTSRTRGTQANRLPGIARNQFNQRRNLTGATPGIE